MSEYLIESATQKGHYWNGSTHKFHTLASGNHQRYTTRTGVDKAAAKLKAKGMLVEVVPMPVQQEVASTG